MAILQLLGPQRFRPTVAQAVRAAQVGGRLAVVTAGWQERESEVEELDTHLGARTVPLDLYRRCEEVFRVDRELFEAHRRRQDRLRELQDLYRVRLSHAKGALRELRARAGDRSLLDSELAAAMESLRSLDRHHVARIREIRDDFETRVRPAERRELATQREEISELLGKSEALLIAGGHVAVLLNRLRLFDVVGRLGPKPVIAWSAGAMALATSVVLFHDSPPQGSGNAEVLDVGLGLCHGIVPLPHARRRLRLDDPERVSLLARRFAPDACVPLDDGAALVWDGVSWGAGGETKRLDEGGALVPLRAA